MRDVAINSLALATLCASLLACAATGQASLESFILVQAVGATWDTRGQAYQIILGPRESSEIATTSARSTGKWGGPEFHSARSELSLAAAEAEIRRLHLCSTGLEIVADVARFDHSLVTKLTARCRPANVSR